MVVGDVYEQGILTFANIATFSAGHKARILTAALFLPAGDKPQGIPSKLSIHIVSHPKWLLTKFMA